MVWLYGQGLRGYARIAKFFPNLECLLSISDFLNKVPMEQNRHHAGRTSQANQVIPESTRLLSQPK
jgi:hypothetical protein